MHFLIQPPCDISSEEHHLTKCEIKDSESAIDQRQAPCDQCREGACYKCIDEELGHSMEFTAISFTFSILPSLKVFRLYERPTTSPLRSKVNSPTTPLYAGIE